MSSTRRPAALPQPSIWMSISVLSRLLASCSPSALRADRTESISSMKMTEGTLWEATAKSARTWAGGGGGGGVGVGVGVGVRKGRAAPVG
jgi:hypothetical protein